MYITHIFCTSWLHVYHTHTLYKLTTCISHTYSVQADYMYITHILCTSWLHVYHTLILYISIELSVHWVVIRLLHIIICSCKIMLKFTYKVSKSFWLDKDRKIKSFWLDKDCKTKIVRLNLFDWTKIVRLNFTFWNKFSCFVLRIWVASLWLCIFTHGYI